MRQAFWTACSLVALAAFGSEKWPNEPKDFRGVPFGATEKEAVAKLGVNSRNCSANGGDRRTCFVPRQTIGEVSTEEVYEFASDKLVNVIVGFHSDQFSYLRDVFVKKYGEPTKVEKTPVKTNAGAEFENEELVWIGDSKVVSLRRYSGTITDGMATIADRAWSEARMKEVEEAKKKAAKSF